MEELDCKPEKLIMDVLETDIGGLFLFFPFRISHMDMKAQMRARTQHMHSLHLGAKSIDGSLGELVDASGSVPLTLHTHNFK